MRRVCALHVPCDRHTHGLTRAFLDIGKGIQSPVHRFDSGRRLQANGLVGLLPRADYASGALAEASRTRNCSTGLVYRRSRP